MTTRARTWQPAHWTLRNAACRGDEPFWVFSCPTCDGCAEQCADCVASMGDPQPSDFNVVTFAEACAEADRYLAGEIGLDERTPSVLGVHRCACGRWYGTSRAGGPMFLARAPGTCQVDECVRCGRDLVMQNERAAGEQLALDVA